MDVRREKQQRNREQHSPLLRYLGLANYWQHLLDHGKFRSITEIAAAEGVDVGRVSQIVRLTQLSPQVTSAVLADPYDKTPLGVAISGRIASEWDHQRSSDPAPWK